MWKGKHGNGVLMQSRGDVLPKDFSAAVKDIKLAILQPRARAAHASSVEALKVHSQALPLPRPGH